MEEQGIPWLEPNSATTAEVQALRDLFEATNGLGLPDRLELILFGAGHVEERGRDDPEAYPPSNRATRRARESDHTVVVLPRFFKRVEPTERIREGLASDRRGRDRLPPHRSQGTLGSSER